MPAKPTSIDQIPTEERWKLIHMVAIGKPEPDDFTDYERELADEMKAGIEARKGTAMEIPLD